MPEPMSPQSCIFHLLSRAARSGGQAWSQEMRALGVTAVQGKVLNILHASGPLTTGELGELAALDGASLTGILDRLGKMELVCRQPKPDDRRAVLVDLSPAGKELAKAVNRRMQPANEQFLSAFSAAETAMLKELLERL